MLTLEHSAVERRPAGPDVFKPFAAAQALSYAGDGLRSLTVVLLIYRLTSSAYWVGVVYALEYVPLALFSVAAGRLADVWNRRLMLIACDAIRFAVLLGFALALLAGRLSLGFVCAGVALTSLAATLFLAAQIPAVVTIVDSARYGRSIAFLYAIEQTAGTIGQPLAGALVALAGLPGALLTNAACYLGSQAVLMTLPPLGPDRAARERARSGFSSEVSRAVREIVRDRSSRSTIALNAFTNVLYFLRAVCILPVLKGAFRFGDLEVGLAFGAMALLSFAVPVAIRRFPLPLGRTLLIGYGLEALASAGLFAARNPVAAVALFAVATALTLYTSSSISGWRMRTIGRDNVGIVLGCIRSVTVLGVLPGTLLGGFLADHYGVNLDLGIAGIGYLIACLLVAGSRSLREESR